MPISTASCAPITACVSIWRTPSRFAKDHGYVKTLFGRRRDLPEMSATNRITKAFGERVAMNTPIQGTAADIIKIAMVRVYRAASGRRAQIPADPAGTR